MRKIIKGLDAIAPFTTRDWKVQMGNTDMLDSLMPSDDRKVDLIYM